MDGANNLNRYLEDFKTATMKISGRINNTQDIWKDTNSLSLQKQIGELAKSAKSVIEAGEKTNASISKFFSIASEKV